MNAEDDRAVGHGPPAQRRTATIAAASLCAALGGPAIAGPSGSVGLPPPAVTGTHSLEQLLNRRRSLREFAATPLTLAQIGQLLWAAQGITARGGLRTAPSAGALYPLRLYLVAGSVEGLAPGIYRYDPHGHRLVLGEPGDRRRALAGAALRQEWIAAAPVIVVFAAVPARTAAKYGGRAGRYVDIEAGHAAENLFLQAEDLGLGTVIVGAFDDDRLARTLVLPHGTVPLLLMPMGHRR